MMYDHFHLCDEQHGDRGSGEGGGAGELGAGGGMSGRTGEWGGGVLDMSLSKDNIRIYLNPMSAAYSFYF